MELIKNRGYRRLLNKVLKKLPNFSGQNTEHFFMKVPDFVLKTSVNFIELCSVIACIPDS